MIRFGIFGDAHYAPNKSYSGRYCGLSLEKVRNCIEIFNRERVDFAVNLGDVIDTSGLKKCDVENLAQIKSIFSSFNGKIYSVLGNHDLETMSKSEFMTAIGMNENLPYYSFSFKGHQFVVLDANFRNDGEDYSCGNYDWEDSIIPIFEKGWLERELIKCGCENITVFIHQNLDDRKMNGALDPHVVKNASEIRQILESSGKNITVFQGHYHPGYEKKINGINYITLKAMCQSPDPKNFYYMIMDIDETGDVSIIEQGAK